MSLSTRLPTELLATFSNKYCPTFLFFLGYFLGYTLKQNGGKTNYINQRRIERNSYLLIKQFCEIKLLEWKK